MSTDADEADDLTVADERNLYRRIPSNQIKPTNDGGYRPISGAFNNASGPEVAQHPDTYVAAITAKLARHEQQRLRRSPTDDDIAHGDVIGHKAPARRKRFAKAAEWAVPPPSAT